MTTQDLHAAPQPSSAASPPRPASRPPSPFGDAFAQAYPGRKISVVIPTGQGGGAERLARAFDDAWGPLLKTQFEYSFFPGASGQIGYELFVKRRPKDGHNLLFGNMGPEMIMYTTQKPDYNFPRDYIYFSMVDIDDSDRVRQPHLAATRPSSRWSTPPRNARSTSRSAGFRIPASIGLLALGEATKSRYNLIPYGGGNPTYIAVLNGEADIGALPMTGVLTLPEKFKVLGVFNRTKNSLADMSENAPLINKVFGSDIPDLYLRPRLGGPHRMGGQEPEAVRTAGADLEGGARLAAVPRGLQEDRRADQSAGLRRPRGVHQICAGDGGAGEALRERADRQARRRQGQEVERQLASRWPSSRGAARCAAAKRA